MKTYFGSFTACPRCQRANTIGRIPRRGWMRIIPGSKHISCVACNMDFVIIGQIQIEKKVSEKEPATESSPYFVKDEDHEIYGPFELPALVAQANDARLGPDFLVSNDQETWKEIWKIDQLEMKWVTTLTDGTEFGPTHISILKELYQSGEIGHDAAARNLATQATIWVADL